MGSKKLAVLTGGNRINDVFLQKKMYSRLARPPKKVAVLTRLPYYRGGREAGFYSFHTNSTCVFIKCLVEVFRSYKLNRVIKVNISLLFAFLEIALVLPCSGHTL